MDEDEIRITWRTETQLSVTIPRQLNTTRTIDLTPVIGMHDVQCLWDGVIEDDLTSKGVVWGCENR